MERVILLLLVLLVFSGRTVSAQTESFPVPRETVADIIPYGGETALLRSGSFGSGAFPYSTALPPVFRRVRVDGIPLPSYSPFGPDLEQVPILFADSLSIGFRGDIRIAAIDSIPEKPITRIAFTSGERRRNHFQGTFHRKVTERSAIFIGGSSDGIRGNERIQGNGSRLYGVKYVYSLEKGGLLNAAVSGGRDRLDLPDIPAQQRMGERTIDQASFSVGLDRYPVSSRTLLTSNAYFRNGSARFERYGTSSRFDDDLFGLSAGLETRRGQSRYTFDAGLDSRRFDGRGDDPDWNDTVADLYGAGAWNPGNIRVTAGAGVRWSAEYGAGIALNGDFALPLDARTDLLLRGSTGHGFPDAGSVLYPSLTYRDTVIAASLDRFRTTEAETGIVRRWNDLSAGIFGFAALSDAPRLDAETATMRFSDAERYAGGRLTLGISGERSVAYTADALVEYTGGTAMKSIWPRPMFRTDVRANVSRYYFNRNLHAAAYGRARLEHRVQSPTPPEGTSFFLDLGISAQVGTLILFYEVENITDTNQTWFGVYETQGRNSLWGIRWYLQN